MLLVHPLSAESLWEAGVGRFLVASLLVALRLRAMSSLSSWAQEISKGLHVPCLNLHEGAVDALGHCMLFTSFHMPFRHQMVSFPSLESKLLWVCQLL